MTAQIGTYHWVSDGYITTTSRYLSPCKSGNLLTIYYFYIVKFYQMAPEVIAGTSYSTKADVYSFAIISWELITRLTPYLGLNPIQVSN